MSNKSWVYSLAALACFALAMLAGRAEAGTVYTATNGVGNGSNHSFHSLTGNGNPTAIPNGGNANFSFLGDATFVDNGDGTAVLSGTLQSDGNANSTWFLTLNLENKRNETDYLAGGFMLKKELPGGDYGVGPGKVDTSTWDFYDIDTATSNLTGIGSVGNGEVLNIGIYMANMGVQVGEGANGKNHNFGLSTWLTYSGTNYSSSHADLNIDLTFSSESQIVPTPAALPAGLGLLGLLSLRRRKRRIS